MSDITGIIPRSGLERDVVALASTRWPTVAPMSSDDIARLLLLIRRARSARDVARHADEWEARAARIRALLAPPADARQPELFDLGGSR